MKNSQTFMFILLTSILGQSLVARAELTDFEIARRFAPIILNEDLTSRDPNGRVSTFHDAVDALFYDVSQTSTHVYVSYQVMKSASQDLQTDNAISGAVGAMTVSTMGINGAPILANLSPSILVALTRSHTYHPVDSEDVFVVLKKEKNGDLSLVTYATNVHGERLIYANPKKVVPEEVDLHYSAARSAEYAGLLSYFKTTPGVQEVLNKDSKVFAVVGERPFIASCGASHSIVAARTSLDSTLVKAKLKSGRLKIYAEDGVDHVDGIEDSKLQKYSLRSVKSVIEEMTFDPGVIELNQGRNEDKSAPCKEMSVSLNGNSVRTPKVPTHYDPRWYLNHYSPDLLSSLEGLAARKTSESKLLNMPEADFFYVHERSPGTKKDGLTDCQRLDPAASFQTMFPKTFRQQMGSRDYTRYDLLSTKAKVYTEKNGDAADSQINGQLYLLQF